MQHPTKQQLGYMTLFCALVYVILGFIVIYRITAVGGSRAATHLQNAQAEFLKNPPVAEAEFQLANEQYLETLQQVTQLPLAFKIFSPLPPARYQIQLLQTQYYLSEAGIEASQMLANTPKTTKKTTLSVITKDFTQNYGNWFLQNKDSAKRSLTSLSLAEESLNHIPKWSYPNQIARLAQFKIQVSGLKASLQKWHDSIEVALSLVQGQDPKSLLIFFENNQKIDSYLVLNAKNGVISSVQPGNIELETNYGLIPEVLAQEYTLRTKNPVVFSAIIPTQILDTISSSSPTTGYAEKFPKLYQKFSTNQNQWTSLNSAIPPAWDKNEILIWTPENVIESALSKK